MVRRLLILCSLGALAAGFSGCSAGSAQAGCVQPQLQTYATPQMVYPAPGGTLSPTGPQLVYLAYPASPPLLKIGGVFTLIPHGVQTGGIGMPIAAVSSLPAGSATPQQGYTSYFQGSIASLPPHTTYDLTFAVTYELGCLAGNTTKTATVSTFTKP